MLVGASVSTGCIEGFRRIWYVSEESVSCSHRTGLRLRWTFLPPVQYVFFFFLSARSRKGQRLSVCTPHAVHDSVVAIAFILVGWG